MHLASPASAIHDGGKELLESWNLPRPCHRNLNVLFIQSSLRALTFLRGGAQESSVFWKTIPRPGSTPKSVLVDGVPELDAERVFLAR